MYVNQSELEDFIGEVENAVESFSRPDEIRVEWGDDRDPEIIEVVENDGEFMGAGALKFQDNLLELGSTIITPEYRKSRTPQGDSVYDELFADRLDIAREMVEDPKDPADIIYTQLLADRSAATQHTADKHDFAVTGVYDKKFPLAYKDKGRVTVVDMLWADSNIENNQDTVYTPESAEFIVNSALDNINDKRSSGLENIDRTVSTQSHRHQDKNYRIKPKVVEDPMNFAEIEIVETETGEYTWDEVLQQISEAQETLQENEHDADYWVGLTLDANSPFIPTAAEELESYGFEYCGFNPGKIDLNGENKDALEMQYRPSDEGFEKQFVDEAAQFIRETGMGYSETESITGYNSSQVLEV